MDKSVKVFHAGTHIAEGRILTHGGRVLGVTALGDGVTDAQHKAYNAVRKLSFKGMRYRTDIGNKAVKYEALASKG